MHDLEEITELQQDMRVLRKKIRDGAPTPEAEKMYKEIQIINRRLMKLRNRN